MVDPRARTDPGRLTLSIGVKLWLGMVLVVGVAATLLFFELAARERESLVRSKVRVAESAADLLANGVAAPLEADDTEAIAKELARIRRDLEVLRVGVWVGDDRRLRAAEPKFPPWPAPEDGTHVAHGQVEVVRPVLNHDDERIGMISVVFSLAAEDHAFDAARQRLLWLCALLAVSTATVLFVFSRLSIVRPIERLADAVRRLEAGERTVTLRADGGDEVGRLTRAFLSMRDAVVDREARLGDLNLRLKELLGSMRQAILVFDRGRRLDAIHSRAAERMFGAESFEGRDVAEVLYAHAEPWMVEPTAFRDWCALAFQCDPDDWADVLELAPTEIVFDDGDRPRAWTLELLPVFAGETLERVMVLVSDESEGRRLREEAARGARAVDAMRRLVATAEVFATYLERTRARVVRACALARGPFTEADRDEVFRALHTIKGESHALDLDELASLAHEAEEVLAGGLATPQLSQDQVAELVGRIEALLGALDGAERRFVALSPTGAAALRRTTVDRDDIERLSSLAEGVGGEIADVAARLASRPFGEYTVALAERVPRLAASQGKRASLSYEGAKTPIPPRLGAALSSVLVHLVRNAIAHGIEAPAQREAAGKPADGVIALGCEPSPAGPIVTVEDDGGGFDRDASTAEEASPASPSSRAKRSADLLSGRGVGLRAARDMLREVGYEMSIDSRPAKGTRFVLAPRGARADAISSRGERATKRSTREVE